MWLTCYVSCENDIHKELHLLKAYLANNRKYDCSWGSNFPESKASYRCTAQVDDGLRKRIIADIDYNMEWNKLEYRYRRMIQNRLQISGLLETFIQLLLFIDIEGLSVNDLLYFTVFRPSAADHMKDKDMTWLDCD